MAFGLKFNLALCHAINFSFSDIVALGVEDAYDKLAIGYIFMFAYTMFVVSQLSRVGNRAYLAIAGILSVVFGLGFSFGVMMALGFKFNQVHGVLPFLAMGESWGWKGPLLIKRKEYRVVCHYVLLALIWIVLVSARFCLGRKKLNRDGMINGQTGGTPELKSTNFSVKPLR